MVVGSVTAMMRSVARADATFQVLDALGRNRKKRRQRGEFLVHGVKPIDAAIAAGWPCTGVVYAEGRHRSRWAERVLDTLGSATHFALAPDLFDQLADRDEPGELIAIAATRQRAFDEIVGPGPVLVLDRPSSPGNLGTLLRSAAAFGVAGVVVLGHAADIYDPRTVRASVGALFSVTVVEAGGAADVAPWLRAGGRRVLGLDEQAPVVLAAVERDRPLAVVLGNEGRGLAAGVKALCDTTASIPMTGVAVTSLNVAVAGSIALYELSRPV
jgi:TrmH family RNA methyltransferase